MLNTEQIKKEQIREIKRSELWNKIYYIVKQIPREKVLGDAMDASSASTEIESLLSQQLSKQREEIILEIRQKILNEIGLEIAKYEELFDRLDEKVLIIKEK